MTRAEILIEIEGEIAKLVQVRRMLVESGRGLRKIDSLTRRALASHGKVRGTATNAAANRSKSASSIPAKRVLSAEGRRRIALAQKKRWARQRRAQKGM
ncbi:MAG TPA: hypothetical protein VM554_03365 [Acidisarcina sp.]|nr:hypothetical protein [Acidisarcina sp.]